MSGRADAVVLFGVSGDLARRMLLPALYELAHADRLGVPVVGVASSDWSDDDLRTHARDAIVQSAAGKVDDGTLDDLTRSLHYVGGDYRQPATFDGSARSWAVLDLLVFRLANVFLDPVWNNRCVDSVQITMAEDFGVAGRGRLYEEVGALRDVVQNHLLQVLTLVAMEPPVDTSPRALAEERTKVLRSMRALDPAEVVRGQYRGNRDEVGRDLRGAACVGRLVALRAWVDSWRWSDVPFSVRAGKRLATTATEVLVEFTRPPRLFFARQGVSPPHPQPGRVSP